MRAAKAALMPVQIAAGSGAAAEGGSLFGVNFRPAARPTLMSSFVIAGAAVLRAACSLEGPSGHMLLRRRRGRVQMVQRCLIMTSAG